MPTSFKELNPRNKDDMRLANSIDGMVELKVDGCCMEFDGTDFLSEKRRVVRNDRFAHIVQELEQIDAKVIGEVAIAADAKDKHGAAVAPHVLNLNKRDNWDKARFYIFDVLELRGKDVSGGDPKDQRALVDEILTPRWNSLRSPRRFKNFKAGWSFVEGMVNRGNYAEGLILQDLFGKHYKVKKLLELKLPVVGHIKGKDKGRFQIQMPGGEVGGISGTSVAWVKKYHDLLSAGEKPMIELECQFLTNDGIPFQPRLRNLDTALGLAS